MKREPVQVDPQWLSYAEPAWVHDVRKADADNRHYWKEFQLSRRALGCMLEYTGDTRSVFEVLNNFPVRDALQLAAGARRILNNDRKGGRHRKGVESYYSKFKPLFEKMDLPDFSKHTVVQWLDNCPEGSLGHEYARYLATLKFDDFWAVMDDFDRTSLAHYVGYRYFRLHDFLHWILGFEPFDPVGETEIEAFMYAQTGMPNNLLFIAGYVSFLARKQPSMIPELVSANFEAYRYGKRAAELMLVDWREHLGRPLDQVRRELGIDERPVAMAVPMPRETPKLVHAVLNVPNAPKAERFFQDLFNYQTVVRDEPLGLVAMTAGNDHHTIALQEFLPDTALRFLTSLPKLLRRARAMGEASGKGGDRSPSGRKVSRPPFSVIRRAVGPGIHHLGFRVPDEQELHAYYRMLRSHAVKVEWACNHADATKSLYVKMPNGVLAEIFCDVGEVRDELEKIQKDGFPEDFETQSTKTWELRVPEDL